MKTSELKRIAYYAYYSCLIVMVVSLIAIVETSGMVIRMDAREASQAKLPAHRAMTDLQTYTNNEYGISFKYDPQFTIAQINTSSGDGVDFSRPYILLYSGLTSDAPCQELGCPPKSGDRDEFIKGATYEGAPPLVPWYKLLRVQGNRWMSIQMTDMSDRCIDQEECGSHIDAMPFKELAKVNDASSKAYDAFIDVLGTLQFMNPVDTSTWQTYRNEKYGFEFKYPKGLVSSSITTGKPYTQAQLDEMKSTPEYSGIAVEKIATTLTSFYFGGNTDHGGKSLCSLQDGFCFISGKISLVTTSTPLIAECLEGDCRATDSMVERKKIEQDPMAVINAIPWRITENRLPPDPSFSLQREYTGYIGEFRIEITASFGAQSWQGTGTKPVADKLFSIDNLLSSDNSTTAREFERLLVQQKLLIESMVFDSGETADWQTYRNDEFGFELKMPKAWQALEGGYSKGADFDLDFRDKKYDGAMEWYGLNIKSYAVEQSDPTFWAVHEARSFAEDTAKHGVDSIYFNAGGKKIYATCTFWNDVSTIDVCNQILSTFKFTK